MEEGDYNQVNAAQLINPSECKAHMKCVKEMKRYTELLTMLCIFTKNQTYAPHPILIQGTNTIRVHMLKPLAVSWADEFQPKKNTL